MILDAWEGNPWTACLATGWFGWCGRSKIQLSRNPTFEPELTPPTIMTPKPWLQNHLNSLDTPNA
jgi:hypothetical protein